MHIFDKKVQKGSSLVYSLAKNSGSNPHKGTSMFNCNWKIITHTP